MALRSCTAGLAQRCPSAGATGRRQARMLLAPAASLQVAPRAESHSAESSRIPADQIKKALGPSPGHGCFEKRQLRNPSIGLGSGITAPETGVVRLGPSGIIQPGCVTGTGRQESVGADRVGPGVIQ